MSGCKRCGKCCEGFPMTYEEFQRIVKYLKANPSIISKLQSEPVPYPNENACVFLRGTKGDTYCAIYSARPEVCKAFGTKGVASLRCPYGAEITTYTPKEAEKLLEVYEVFPDQLINPNRLIKELLKGGKVI